MKKSFVCCEYHIEFDERWEGLYHIVSPDSLPIAVIERLKQSIRRLSLQYNYRVLKCLEYVTDENFLDDSNVSFAITDGEIYLLNILDYLDYCEDNIGHPLQIYVFSHDLYAKLRKRLDSHREGDSQVFEEIIRDAYNQEGLLYGFIKKQEKDWDVFQEKI